MMTSVVGSIPHRSTSSESSLDSDHSADASSSVSPAGDENNFNKSDILMANTITANSFPLKPITLFGEHRMAVNHGDGPRMECNVEMENSDEDDVISGDSAMLVDEAGVAGTTPGGSGLMEDNTTTNATGSEESGYSVVDQGHPASLDDDEEDSDAENKDDEYEVENILDVKADEKGNVYFKVHWKGWSNRHNSWEPVEHLVNAQEKLQDFVNNKARQENILPTEAAVDAIRKTGAKGHSINVLHIPQNRKMGEWLVTVMPKRSAEEIKAIASERLKRFERTIQDICLAAKEPLICVVNKVDTEGPPEDFQYIIDYIAGDGVVIPDEPPLFCLCGTEPPEPGKPPKRCSHDNNGCCPVALQNYRFAYLKNKKLRIAPGSPIFECNKHCKCAANPELCDNRVVQKGRQFPMTIKRCAGKGWGVFVDKPVKRDEFLLEYIGEVIDNVEAERRGRDYDLQGSTYLFDLDFDDADNVYTVDATFYGNITHFVNHSCDPNMAMFPVWINCLDPRLPRIAFFARRDIKAGEELTFNYNDSACRNIKKNSKKVNVEEDRADAANSAIKRQKCLCQASTCCGFFFR